MPGRDRWSLVEYGAPKEILATVAEQAGLSITQARDLILSSGTRVAKALKFASNPITVLGDTVRAVDFAGLLRVAPGIEIEIAPKFLGLDSVNRRWREDFFYIATLSRHGRLLTSERLRAGSGERGDLHTLVARTMVDSYWSNHRRPLRTYRVRRFSDFAVDGDMEPDAVAQPGSDGFDQTVVLYDRRNPYNAVVLAAARGLLANLRDPSAIAQLQRMIAALAPQRTPGLKVRSQRLPSRARRWQPLFDLSVDVLNGLGLSLTGDSAKAPGYVLDTWRVWQDFVSITVRIGVGPQRLRLQAPAKLGTRYKIVKGSSEAFSDATVTPDLAVYATDSDTLSFLIDAKYKGNVEAGRLRVSEADIYEALAFSEATGCKKVLLVYPAQPSAARSLGKAETFEAIHIGEVRIVGVEVETMGISSLGGLNSFAYRCAGDLETIASNL
jgi:5-methylcytosine-specific restriction enzyme subunit McrC